ncbi:MAG: hypothetical protein L3J17_06875 [Candidatus Jettenia sp.]|nr:MAG: hypothetical protein L3J17_06875 [Candidatus Jettenia sp.]
MNNSKYSAAESLIGYIYQCRLALLESLKRLKSDPDIAVAIESLDDVVFEKDGSPTEVIQVKHHIKRKASLTNASSDLWKTIRIWSDLFAEGVIKEGAILCLMTTETATDSSAARFLRVEGRDISVAESLLLRTSQTSSNENNKDAYVKFNSLQPDQRKTLLDRMLILDNCPLSKDLRAYLNHELWGHCDRQHAEQFLCYLEGWWLQRVVARLDSDRSKPITGQEIDSELMALREQFKLNALPIHPEIQAANPDVTPFANWVFTKQLRLINVGENRIQRAVKNFYQASEQRSRWVREDLLVDNEMDKYDDTLKEEWAIRFEQSKDSMASNANSADKIASGQKIYQWAEAEADFPIRPSCQARFITRGSYQMLANRLQVGWHPDFESLLSPQSEEENL